MLKHKKKIKKIKNQTWVSFGPKTGIWPNTCFAGEFDKVFIFVDQKYHTWDTFGAKKQKGDYTDQKPNLRFFKA